MEVLILQFKQQPLPGLVNVTPFPGGSNWATRCCSSLFRSKSGHGHTRRRQWKHRGVESQASSSMQSSAVTKVVFAGVSSPLAQAGVRAVYESRGLEVAGAVDMSPDCVGQDLGLLAGLPHSIEVPVLNDIVMMLGFISQSRASGVFVDFSGSEEAYENVRQATAFGLRSIVVGPSLNEEQLEKLVTFCEKASTGCVVTLTLCSGAFQMAQAAASAAFYYDAIEVIDRVPYGNKKPSLYAELIVDAVCGLGKPFQKPSGNNAPPGARTDVVGDGVIIHSVEHLEFEEGQPLHELEVVLTSEGQALRMKHEVRNHDALVQGLPLAIRRVTRLKSLVYGLEKLL